MKPWAIHDGDRQRREDLPPVQPAMELGEAVGAHQPDEADTGIAHAQERQRSDAEMTGEPGLERRHANAIVLFHGLALRPAFAEKGKSAVRLQRIARRHDPPDGIETKAAKRDLADLPVALVRRIERAAEQPDALPGACQRRAGCDRTEANGC